MTLTNCQQCGDLYYQYSSGRRCPRCLEAEEDAFQRVLAHLRQTQERSIPRIAEATEVDQRLIIRWLRQKRIGFEVVPGELSCRRCGTAVSSGSFCERCQRALADAIAEQLRPAKPARSASGSQGDAGRGMRYRSYTEDSSS